MNDDLNKDVSNTDASLMSTVTVQPSAPPFPLDHGNIAYFLQQMQHKSNYVYADNQSQNQYLPAESNPQETMFIQQQHQQQPHLGPNKLVHDYMMAAMSAIQGQNDPAHRHNSLFSTFFRQFAQTSALNNFYPTMNNNSFESNNQDMGSYSTRDLSSSSSCVSSASSSKLQDELDAHNSSQRKVKLNSTPNKRNDLDTDDYDDVKSDGCCYQSTVEDDNVEKLSNLNTNNNNNTSGNLKSMNKFELLSSNSSSSSSASSISPPFTSILNNSLSSFSSNSHSSSKTRNINLQTDGETTGQHKPKTIKHSIHSILGLDNSLDEMANGTSSKRKIITASHESVAANFKKSKQPDTVSLN